MKILITKQQYQILNENLDKHISNKNHGLLLKTHKRFWIGSVNVFDGEIEEVHTYEEAKENDFHHSFYFSPSQLSKIDDDECMIFWIDEDGIQGEWTHGKIPGNIKLEIKRQIEIL